MDRGAWQATVYGVTKRHKRHGFDLWVGKIPGVGNGNQLQYSYLGNPRDRGAWQATVHGITKSRTRLSDFTFFHLVVPRQVGS